MEDCKKKLIYSLENNFNECTDLGMIWDANKGFILFACCQRFRLKRMETLMGNLKNIDALAGFKINKQKMMLRKDMKIEDKTELIK